ncbi:ISL3 family transposase, partial [Acidaminococcus intestini]
QAIIQPYSNGFTEGCNNLIKTVKRVAFGMRDFNRFRNRILYVNWQKRNSANALPSS